MVKDQAKQEVRERVWALLEQERVVPPGVRGRIPAFVGAEAAAERLAKLSIWWEAAVIKAVPDKAQLPVRARALAEGKLVYMAVPKLAEAQPFYLLDPAALTVPATEAASSKIAATMARRVDVEEMRPVDLIVCGSVAVNRQGVRLGKGAGYSDIEVALLHEAGLIGPDTTIVTTVHSLQVVAGDLPEAEHDFRVDFIVTPDEVIECGPPRRPRGLYWESLPQEMIDAIPALATRRSRG
ncbi:5-formyltetrahydrofolate cyclo-ligase [Microbispora hainanensis]|uniref:5-formyltetrahydrofolate cyclo-ligase n=1 Tax=Microbispora TaxID=2005 RepID=UPI00115AD26B|nr:MULTISPECIES: 5-formyltetrahydrofolate cyclo-ligase [Microbispora]NJP25269.1 5-formyltetrahydrofolate cyclo-ligase [Microbispora sp. CL1-1]TQS13718.1 5-formyltetrahydrofolate cyclo-ligase [Microbispora sp. SCL1-1]